MKAVVAAPVAPLDEIAPGRALLSLAAGPSGDLVALSADRPVPARQRDDGVFHYRVHRWRPGRWDALETVDLEPTDGLHGDRRVQPLGAGGWVLVGTRTGRRPPVHPLGHNAVVYTALGARRSSFAIGDAVEHVQTAADGSIWVGYFDEGVFGGGDLSPHGVVCFAPDGTPVFRYSALAREHSLPGVDDCYAMNVAPEGDVWLFYYTDFPLVRLHDRWPARVWRVSGDAPIIGSHAFAVAGDRALFVGGYRRHERLFLVALDSPSGPTVEEVGVVDARGDPLQREPPWRAFARGSVLYLHTVSDLVAIDLAGGAGG